MSGMNQWCFADVADASMVSQKFRRFWGRIDKRMLTSMHGWYKILNFIMTENEISYKIRGILFDIYNKLGPGLFESVYEEILCHELARKKIAFSRQKALPVRWKTLKLDHGFRADIIVENKVIIELKSIESLSEIHTKQLLTYLGLSGLKLGLLVNFNATPLTIKRLVNKL